jgi:hypothetical protein
VIVGIIAKKYDIPVATPYNGTASFSVVNGGKSNQPITIATRNSTESALVTMHNSALNTNSGYYKLEYVERMYKLLKNGDVDEGTKQLAIRLIDKVSKSTNSAYYKDEMLDIVTKIAALPTKEEKDEKSSD